MDPGTGQLYTHKEMKFLPAHEQERLVQMEGRVDDLVAISRAVTMANAGNLTGKEIRAAHKSRRRAKNRVAAKTRRQNRGKR